MMIQVFSTLTSVGLARPDLQPRVFAPVFFMCKSPAVHS